MGQWSRVESEYASRCSHLPKCNSIRTESIAQTSLLGLSDEVLALVFKRLCGLSETEFMQGRILTDARHAFALSQCSTRLMKVFVTSCLRRIDSSHIPATFSAEGGAQPAESSYIRYLLHLNAVAWLAADALQEMHIGSFHHGNRNFHGYILSTMKDVCPNLNKLTFDGGDIDHSSLVDFFSAAGSNIKNLRIINCCPGTLDALIHSNICFPRDVTLNDISTQDLNLILHFLEYKGFALESLGISLRLEPSHLTGCCGHKLDILHFSKSLDSYLQRLSPELSVLSFSLRQGSGLLCTDGPDSHTTDVSYFDKVRHKISSHRKNVDPSPWKLKRLVVSGSEWETNYVLCHFQALISAEFIQINLPGASFVFPTDVLSLDFPFFRALRICESYCSLALDSARKQMFSRLEMVDVGSYLTFDRHSLADTRLETVRIICTSAKQNLKALHLTASFSSEVLARSAASNFLNLLLVCSNVKSIDIPCSFVAYGIWKRESIPDFAKLAFSKLHTVQLSISKEFMSYDAQTRLSSAFAENLAHFLEILDMCCSQLQGVYMPVLSDLEPEQDFYRLRQAVRTARNVVEDIECRNPTANLCCIRGQLERWAVQCY